ncbi:MAG: mannose-1-phosphate guanylyltransferase [Candidatus Lokiarchaeota archaeon]|nr:mannose-1-phosphate guanylyltransferase [Candidatus Lokiarchaeota archaeon]
MKTIPVILAGGQGKRFWPLSRKNIPKQNLPLISDKPMIVDTINRLDSFPDKYIVANEELCTKFEKLLSNHVNYIIEPSARNTAAAIGLACIKLKKEFDDSILFFDTADHYYKDVNHYLGDIKDACKYANETNKIVLVGIKPTYPHTGYGYIKSGKNLEHYFFNVDEFKEKPDEDTAKRYIAKKIYYWNSGIFISKCSVMLEEIEKYMPDLYSSLEKIYESDFKQDILETEFSKLDKISIDYGVLERSDNIALLKSSMDWDDIGDYNALARIMDPDEDWNYAKNKINSVESLENIVISDKLVGLVGVENLVVVETHDAILICKRSDTQKIKDLVNKLDPKYQ